ncbi:NAD(P)/FAD-dependent oxidoreductase [Shimia marina]|uniref:Bifunctional tRNA (Mnm(5)s(2)U34)-methyltransferase/FAD-dependent cmnm(5)s(2)U34 oxidoreductase n=1 Tax=Shimia marina TaxID=321267 RepID=A0A0P1ETT5_9RHOB|nr:FAD-dependent oxidoreductase [Shimia marina]CUH54039.1 bifunctional tRNA (mnm(5)s(2)U34)-methyltransferase/FAD-dependent cmnm(5)s(2)U34 oxidoreductase [Shimia marina]SFE16164.1 Glycine/D-amino acid oxidase [Shimia marina]
MIDFLIIGGGIAGLSAAARLAPLGKTLVLERETALGYHASGRSAAMFEPNYGLPSTIALSRASAAFFATTDGGFLSPRGVMFLAKSEDRDAFSAACDNFEAIPLPLDEAHQRVPIINRTVAAYAALHQEASDIDTDRFLQWCARTCRAHGGDVLTNQDVTEITRISSGWQVQTPTAIYETKLLLNAGGAWADHIATRAGIAPLGITPMRRSMARIPAPGGYDLHDWPMLLDVHEHWYAKPDAGSLIISPAEEDPMAPFDAWPDDMVLAEGIARYQKFVTEEVTHLEASWAGLRSFTPDRNLALGPDRQDPTFVWVAGQGGYGFQSAPAAAQLIADLISGQPSELDAATRQALDPRRFS